MKERRHAPSEGKMPLLRGGTPASGGIPERERPALDWAEGMRLPSGREGAKTIAELR